MNIKLVFKRVMVYCSAACCLASASVWGAGANCEGFNTQGLNCFENGTTANADIVNANFKAMLSKIDQLQAQVTTLSQQLGVATSKKLKFSYKEHGFDNVKTSTIIPGSQGATFCALAEVDDDSLNGGCYLGYDTVSKEWVHRTGGVPGDNWCKAVCVWVSLE